MNHESLKKSLGYIEAELSGHMGVEAIAECIHYSRSRFLHCFKAAFGMTPTAYLRQRRMMTAAKLLIETNYDMTYIALSCGYESREGFTRAFKSVCGISPYKFKVYDDISSVQESLAIKTNEVSNNLIAQHEILDKEIKTLELQHNIKQPLLSMASTRIKTMLNRTKCVEPVLFEDIIYQINVIALQMRIYAARAGYEVLRGKVDTFFSTNLSGLSLAPIYCEAQFSVSDCTKLHLELAGEIKKLSALLRSIAKSNSISDSLVDILICEVDRVAELLTKPVKYSNSANDAAYQCEIIARQFIWELEVDEDKSVISEILLNIYNCAEKIANAAHSHKAGKLAFTMELENSLFMSKLIAHFARCEFAVFGEDYSKDFGKDYSKGSDISDIDYNMFGISSCYTLDYDSAMNIISLNELSKLCKKTAVLSCSFSVLSNAAVATADRIRRILGKREQVC